LPKPEDMSFLMLETEREVMKYDSESVGEFGKASARDTVFEQLLRLAASYASSPMAGGQEGSRSAIRKGPVAEDIELRAYQIYLGRGAAHGHDLEDWLQAERQVFEELKRNKASLRLALAFGVSKEPK
jgi:DUF2934 family protein